MKSLKLLLAAFVCATALLATIPARAQGIEVTLHDNGGGDFSWEVVFQSPDIATWIEATVNGSIFWNGVGGGSEDFGVSTVPDPGVWTVDFTAGSHHYAVAGDYFPILNLQYLLLFDTGTTTTGVIASPCDGGQYTGLCGIDYGFNAHVSAPVPEPEIYAMMGLGLGLLGWVGRRRKLQAA